MPCRNSKTVGVNQVEPIIGRSEAPSACPFPFVGIADPFAHSFADFGSFRGTHPHHRVDTRDVRKLELVDTDAGVLGLLGLRIIKGRHEFCTAQLFKLRIFVMYGQLAEFLFSRLLRCRMSRHGRISLPHISRFGEDRPYFFHLLCGQGMDRLKFVKKRFVLFSEVCVFRRNDRFGHGDADHEANES
jgi:hypothetical protein